MNTGAEAVESGLKVVRKWGYEVRGVPDDRARVVVMAGGFHGRTISIVSFSTDPDARGGFGPFTPGFDVVPYGPDDPAAAALAAAITPETVAVLLEPVQGEAGVVVPPPGYLAAVRRVCDDAGVLLVADEIQSGLGRTGHLLATRAAGVDADVYLLGKALGGGILPLSAVVADAGVLGVLRPGQHGSTFGGNPLACAVGSAVVGLLSDAGPDGVLARARALGEVLADRLAGLVGRGVVAVRCAGAWAGVDVDPRLGTGRQVCEALARRGVLAKDTHGSTIRLSPPLVATPDDVGSAVDALAAVLAELG
jgi:ornithine--oxo-acid transaminase